MRRSTHGMYARWRSPCTASGQAWDLGSLKRSSTRRQRGGAFGRSETRREEAEVSSRESQTVVAAVIEGGINEVATAETWESNNESSIARFARPCKRPLRLASLQCPRASARRHCSGPRRGADFDRSRRG